MTKNILSVGSIVYHRRFSHWGQGKIVEIKSYVKTDINSKVSRIDWKKDLRIYKIDWTNNIVASGRWFSIVNLTKSSSTKRKRSSLCF